MENSNAYISSKKQLLIVALSAIIVSFATFQFQAWCNNSSLVSSQLRNTVTPITKVNGSHANLFYGSDDMHGIDTLELKSVSVPTTIGSTGVPFSGKKIRTYHYKSDTDGGANFDLALIFPKANKDHCNQWAVVTTIHEPTLSILKVAGLPRWCIVVVGDEITPNENYKQLASERSNFAYLSISDQNAMMKSNKFIELMPTRSFARKNIGYLFAIANGAEVIFDFDDDNILVALNGVADDDSTPIPPPFFLDRKPLQSTESEKNGGHSNGETMMLRFCDENEMQQKEHHPLAFNPYHHMGPSLAHSWPRGYPINLLQRDFEKNSNPDTVLHPQYGDISIQSIGVIQSLCNGDPDSDAILRLTRPKSTRFTFEEDIKSLPLLIPPKHYSPYNAQATTHLYNAFWGLLLPITVPGRVTDIWRGYFVQRIMKDIGLSIVYTPPIVYHNRSDHDYISDFAAETDLYMKTSKLLDFLDNWSSDSELLQDRILQLWISLFEHNYISAEDVEAVGSWLQTLVAIGYEFPSVSPQLDAEKKSQFQPRTQPLTEGQPYRSNPYFNVNKDGQTFSEYASVNQRHGGFNEWQSTVDMTKRPTDAAVLKIILMTMDEWPMIQDWLYVSASSLMM